jgi:hypothetical protein
MGKWEEKKLGLGLIRTYSISFVANCVASMTAWKLEIRHIEQQRPLGLLKQKIYS